MVKLNGERLKAVFRKVPKPRKETPEAFKSRRIPKSIKISRGATAFAKATKQSVTGFREDLKEFRERRDERISETRSKRRAKIQEQLAELREKEELEKLKQRMKRKKRGFLRF